MKKQQRIRELDEIIAKAQAEREQLAKEKEFWVPEGEHWLVRPEGNVTEGCMYMDDRAEFGHVAPDKGKAYQLRNFFSELVQKHPVPEVGQTYWVVYGKACDPVQWDGDEGDWMHYNTGRTWDHEPTREEIERKRAVLSFDSSWRWV